jgi:hypothetical protein
LPPALRPGIQVRISDTTRGHFDLSLAEGLHRPSRDRTDIASLLKRASYGVRHSADATIFNGLVYDYVDSDGFV